MKVKHSIWGLSALMLLLLSTYSFAQTNRGSITGTVTDTNGGVIPNAKVTVTSIGTNQSRTVTTSENGSYNFTLLEPVLYKIIVEAAGFKKAILESIKVDTTTVTTANIKLEVGTVDATVTITSNEISINADNGTVGQTINERQITDIPLQERNVLNLLMTLPNISGEVGSDVAFATIEDPPNAPAPGTGLSVGGSRPGQTSFLADGVQNTSAGSGRALTTFTPDTVQEVNVKSSAYSAEFGQSLGGVVNITTKSGTNNFHGTAYYFKKDASLSAAPYSIVAKNEFRPVAATNQKEYGFTVGGPIYLPTFGEGGQSFYKGKNRSFFFFAYEPRRTTDTSKNYYLMPDEAMRSGNFSGVVNIPTGPINQAALNAFLARTGTPSPVVTDATIFQQFVVQNGNLIRCAFPGAAAALGNGPGCPALVGTGINQTFAPFANNTIPANMIDPTAVKILRYLPLPTNPELFIDANGNVSNWAGNRSAVSNDDRFQFRLDHQITQANKIYGRFSYIPIESDRYVNVAGDAVISEDDVSALPADKQAIKQVVISDTHIFSPTVVNDVRIGTTRGDFSRVNPPRWQKEGFAQLFGLPSITEANLPVFTGFMNSFPIGNQRLNLLGSEIDQSYQVSDSLTWIRGNQVWKMGVDLRQRRLKTEPIGTAAGGQYTFNGSPTNSRNFATGGVNTGGVALATFLLGVPTSYNYRTTIMAYYYQWKEYAAFFQDDWKLKPNFTVNMGMRFALNIPRTEKYDRQGSYLIDEAFDVTYTEAQRRTLAARYGYTLAATDPIPSDVPTTTKSIPFAFSGRGGRDRTLMPIDWNGWEPRIGFAYVPRWGFVEKIFGKDRLSIRGGYGLTHSSLTGLGSSPSPDFAANAAASVNYAIQTATAQQGTGQCNLSYNIRLSGNPPCLIRLTQDQAVGVIPTDGVVRDTNALFRFGANAIVISPNAKVPRSQTWNLTASWEIRPGTVLELSYTGNRGSRLFLSGQNLNATKFDTLQTLIGRGVTPANTTANIADPLGRTNATGVVPTVPQYSVYGPYAGYTNVISYFDSSGWSTRHAGSAYLNSRLTNGLRLTAAYTWAKAMDVGSDAGGASPPNISASRSQGYYLYGRDLSVDKAVSTFDVPHTFATTFIYDLPFGRGGYFFENVGYLKNMLVGGWTLTGTGRISTGYPWAAFIGGGNGFDNTGLNIRFNLNPDPSIPFKNPNYSKSCSIERTCEPYFNPAKLIIPPFGTLGTAPRTFGNVRGPLQEFFDLSLQKNIPVGKEKSKRIQLRIDAINVFNHPNLSINSTGGFNQFLSGRGINIPNYTAAITTAEFDAWVAADPSRASKARTADGGATFNQVVALFNNNRVRNSQTGAVVNYLPVDFFSVPIPAKIATAALNSYDITTLEGFKYYRIKQAYNPVLGTLSTRTQDSRKVQWTVKFFF